LLHGQTFAAAQAALSGFLACFDEPLEICTDAPNWDWDFFCDLAYVDRRWPAHVINRPTNLITLFSEAHTDTLQDVELPDLPHHALLDARILAVLYQRLVSAS
jgi:DNA polymerase III epsilon subunit-like protein